jgi:flagellar hook-associated protein 1 FlgK
MAGLYSIGSSALNNAQAGVVTSGHNIANANTPGFSRQVVEQQTNLPNFVGVGFIGQGATVGAIRRIYDEFLGQQVTQANSQGAELSTYLERMQRIDSMLGDPTAGVAPSLAEFFQGLQAVAANPADMSARQSLLSGAQSLASRLNSTAAQLGKLRDAANIDMQSSVARINALSGQIAALNDSISLSSATAGTGQQPNDLLDQRDTLIADLNREVRADVVKASNGSYNLFLSNGQALVLDRQAYKLGTVRDAADPADTQVTVSIGSAQMRLQPGDLSGGRLGGILGFRQGGLTDAQDALGRLAISVAAGVNDQHSLGQDLTGALGGTFFKVGSPTVISNATNSGTGVVSAGIAGYGALEASDYNLTYDGTNYTLTRLSDNKVVGAVGGLPQTVDGVTIGLASGVPAAGDQFLIQPTRAGANGNSFSVLLSDLRSIAAAAPIRTAAGLNNAGTGAVSAGTVNAPPPNVNLRQPVTITFTSATTFNVAGTGTLNPVGVAYTAGANISYNGWTIQISGTPAANDAFTVGPNTNGQGDNRNARLMAALQTQPLMANGSATYSDTYGQLVSQVGNKTHELQVNSEAQTNLTTAMERAQGNLSGVNLDEEASNLIRYQQAYQAAGKMVSIAGLLFDTILNIGS